MSEERSVALVCTDGGQHGSYVLAELALRDGVAVDLRLPGRERLRQAFEGESHHLPDFDRRCRACGRNPRARQSRLDTLVAGVLQNVPAPRRVVVDLSREGATLF